jgi:hypothetical protein
VNNDPVNWVDLWGLSASDKQDSWYQIGQDMSEQIQHKVEITYYDLTVYNDGLTGFSLSSTMTAKLGSLRIHNPVVESGPKNARTLSREYEEANPVYMRLASNMRLPIGVPSGTYLLLDTSDMRYGNAVGKYTDVPSIKVDAVGFRDIQDD